MKTTDSALVVKSNRLIEASYRLDIAEQRLILMAIHEARETGLGVAANSFLTIRVDEYASMFGLDPKSTYKQLKTAIETLYHRSVRLHDVHPESGKERIVDVRWVSSVAYVEGAGLVQIKFGDDVIPLITVLEKEFTSYKIKSVAQMTSTYAIRLYELLMQWEKIGKREVKLDEFKQMLQVEGQYPALKDFKNRVLDLAVSQVNEFSDLQIRYENVKFGRKVTGFMFFFEPKPEKQPKPAKAVSKVKSSVSGFAGLELIMFNQLKKTYPDLTQADIHKMTNKDDAEPVQVMQRMKNEIGNTEKFKLEKSL